MTALDPSPRHGPDAPGPTFSVVVPAHDEARVIERCLRSLLAGTTDPFAEIVVVCNGCTDDTAERARAFAPRVTVVEIAEGSKPLALDTGDAVATAFPRFYVDADVAVSPGALDVVAAAMRERGLHGAAPRIAFDLTGATLGARLFYDTWTRSPYFGDHLIGAGFYGLSEQGRKRFGSFPRGRADDLFVQRCIAPAERAAIDGATFTPLLPLTLRDLVRVRTRHKRNDAETAAELAHADAASAGAAAAHLPPPSRWLRDVARQGPARWPGLAVFVAANAVAAVRHRLDARRGRTEGWARDRSSRG